MEKREEEIVRLFEGIQEQLSKDWDQFRNQHHNPSVKGSSYEEALKDLLDKYYSGVYEILTNTVILDQQLDVFDVFDTAKGENEIDVVGLFESARPRIVFNVRTMTYTPLRGAAFLCEVKSAIDSNRLEHDLEKLQKVTKLMDMNEDRWAISQTGTYSVTHQIRCLVYDGNSISEEELVDKVVEYSNVWDLLLIVEDNTLLVNSSLPIFKDINRPLVEPFEGMDIDEISRDIFESVDEDANTEIDLEEAAKNIKMMTKRGRNFGTLDNGLIMFIMILSASIPRPLGVDTTDIIKNLSEEYQNISQQDQ